MTPLSQQSVAQEFDSYHTHYAETVDAALGLPGFKVDFFTRVKADYLVDILSKHLGQPKDMKLLDIGCGVGVYHDYLAQRVGELQGVDVSQKSIETASEAHPSIVYQSYDGHRLPYDDNSFDAALTICVMHHVPPSIWGNFMSEMRRVVKPGGLAIVFEHNPYNPLTMNIVNRCPFDADAVLLKPNKTRSLMKNAKLKDITSRYILNVPAGNKALRVCDSLFSRLPSGAQYYCLGRKV